MELQLSAFIAPFITSLITAVGVYVAMSNRLSVVETKLDSLAQKVEKHNNMVERTYKLEQDAATQWVRYDEMKNEIRNLREER